MYIQVKDFALEGDYVVNRYTGAIKQVRWVDSEGGAVVAELFPLDFEVDSPEIVVWSINEYFVLVKVVDMYFDGNFRFGK